MILFRAKKVAKEKGYLYVISSGIRIPIERFNSFFNQDNIQYYRYKIFKSRLSFNFNGKRYNYFYHPYNATWKNERTVEVPIAMEIICNEDFNSNNILEVGNVLSHYFPVSHDIIDKYEIADNVVNCDISEIQTSKKYDLILCISTLEHVGWDEHLFDKNFEEDTNSLDETTILNAIKKLRTLLQDQGKIIFTVPVGYNKILDGLLKENRIPINEMYCLKRISDDNKWIQVDWEEIENINYEFYPCYRTKGLVIGIIE